MEALAALHPADQAELYDRLDEDDRETMVSLLSAEGIAHLLEHLDEEDQRPIVERMPRAALGRVLDLTDNDIAVDVLRMLPASEAVRTLSNMTTAAEITPLLGHSDETAGGIMTRGYVALHKDMTVGEALNFLRSSKPLAEEAYYLYVLDAEDQLAGHGLAAPARGLRPADAHRGDHDSRGASPYRRRPTRRRPRRSSSTTGCAHCPSSTRMASSAASSPPTTSSTSSRKRPRRTCTRSLVCLVTRACYAPVSASVAAAVAVAIHQPGDRVRRRCRGRGIRRHDRKGRRAGRLHAGRRGAGR